MALKESYSWRDYWPLLAIASAGLIAGVVGWLWTGNLMRAMTFFMGTGLTLLASLKVVNLSEFVMTFSKYDLLAKQNQFYAKAYPFIELALGISYLSGAYLLVVNILTFLVMTIGAIGVYQKMHDGEVLMCACLGAVFNVPMTWVTFVEDTFMGVMAFVMIII